MDEIRKVINSCISILRSMRIDYNTPIGPRTNALMSELFRLIPLLESEQSCIANCLKNAIANISFNGLINAYSFGDIRTALNILNDIYSKKNDIPNVKNSIGLTTPKAMSKKIFISHSSKDKIVVEKFVDHILMLGLGLSSENIFCTSIEDLAIKNGEDIREHIHSNIKNADFSILLISNNYKQSEICLNEMGAVWAYNNNVRFYLLPDSDFDKIGWLCNPIQAEKLFNSITLDALKMELSAYYSLTDTGTTWSRQREIFLKETSIVPKIQVEKHTQAAIDVINNLDYMLDCNVYEMNLLKLLEENPNATQQYISKQLGLSIVNVKRTISSLISKGFIEQIGTTHKLKWVVKI